MGNSKRFFQKSFPFFSKWNRCTISVEAGIRYCCLHLILRTFMQSYWIKRIFQLRRSVLMAVYSQREVPIKRVSVFGVIWDQTVGWREMPGTAKVSFHSSSGMKLPANDKGNKKALPQ
jgi:hypothetical protein